MSNKPAPTSILELLTHPNPTVSHQRPKSKTNTHGTHLHCPRQIKKWKDFPTFRSLDNAFGGRLLRAALQEGRNLPPYPTIYPEIHCVLRDEEDTKGLLHKWNESIVNAALRPIQHEFHAAIWRRGDAPTNMEPCEPPPREEAVRMQPQRQCSDKARKPKMHSLGRLKPDSGTSCPKPAPPGSYPTATTFFCQERFPKEYKPATKWRSEWLEDPRLLNQAGLWKKGQMNDNVAWPIRQAFSYCIKDLCRYGCILTCYEAFIFRVQPLDECPGK